MQVALAVCDCGHWHAEAEGQQKGKRDTRGGRGARKCACSTQGNACRYLCSSILYLLFVLWQLNWTEAFEAFQLYCSPFSASPPCCAFIFSYNEALSLMAECCVGLVGVWSCLGPDLEVGTGAPRTRQGAAAAGCFPQPQGEGCCWSRCPALLEFTPAIGSVARGRWEVVPRPFLRRNKQELHTTAWCERLKLSCFLPVVIPLAGYLLGLWGGLATPVRSLQQASFSCMSQSTVNKNLWCKVCPWKET